MATNKVFKVIRTALKKSIGNSGKDWAEITTSRSGTTNSVTATYASAKSEKVAFYSKVPAENDSTNAPVDLSLWTFLGTVTISGTSCVFSHTLTEFSAISYCACMVLQDNPLTDNGTAEFSL